MGDGRVHGDGQHRRHAQVRSAGIVQIQAAVPDLGGGGCRDDSESGRHRALCAQSEGPWAPLKVTVDRSGTFDWHSTLMMIDGRSTLDTVKENLKAQYP